MRKRTGKASTTPNRVEDRTYQFWQGWRLLQSPGRLSNKKPYTIMMLPAQHHRPAPHGLRPDATFQDVLIRFRRMQGYSALWLPGTDHASICHRGQDRRRYETGGASKEDLGRDGFP